jgi:molybdate transport system permease protein
MSRGRADYRLEAVDCVVDRGTFRVAIPSLRVAPGRVHALTGPSGSGKTTLLWAFAGLLTLARGKLLVDGVDRTHVPPEQRRLPLVPQEAALFPRMTLEENVAFGLRVQGLGAGARKLLARHWLERLGLGTLGHRKPHEVSGGQAQRVSLARALAVDAPVVLLDEPWAHLDEETRAMARGALRETLSETGRSAILVTHDRSDVTFFEAEETALPVSTTGASATPDAIR